MMKKTKFFLAFVFGLISVLILTAPTHAADPGLNYQLLEKIPGTSGLSGSNLGAYIQAIYKVALIVVTLSAVFMVSVGGFMYLTSAGNTSAMSSAKSVISDALIGLVIALVAWLVLYVINPDLIKSGVPSLPPVEVTITPIGPIGPPPAGSDQQLAEQIIGNNRIRLLQTGDCKSPSGMVSPFQNIADIKEGRLAAKCSARCTAGGGCVDNAVNLNHTLLSAMATVGQTMAFTVTSISGGPHGGGSSHYDGNAIDVQPVSQALLDAFIAAGAKPVSGNSQSMCERMIGNVATSVNCTTGGGNHIHIVF